MTREFQDNDLPDPALDDVNGSETLPGEGYEAEDTEMGNALDGLFGLQQKVQKDLPAVPHVAAAPTPVTIEQPGDFIGRYKLIHKVGEGGMGIVWMAVQFEPVQRRVALKVIKVGMDTREVVARFEAERQALALMQHPNIAQVLDGGATDSGRPYFVMEMVQGIPVTEYSNKATLSTRDRLRLFMQICEAIQHAHQKGIIHRDIKPSNVLVTNQDGKALPKVIDFGIAKATSQRLTERTLFTQFGQMVGTPAYMSPEQAELTAEDIDTRSDIYSLGVLLYELLTGSTPFEDTKLRQVAIDELCRIIREVEPPKPSARLSTLGRQLLVVAQQRHTDGKKLSHQVHGELDWIAMKALEKDRSRRYQTAAGFAEDVERYLNNEAVDAGPPSTTYRLKKFARRHSGAITAAAIIIVTMIAGTVTSLWYAKQVGEQRNRAEASLEDEAQQRKITDGVREFLTNHLLRSANPVYGSFLDQTEPDLSVATVVERASDSLMNGQFIANDPLIEAAIHLEIGSIFDEFGRARKAEIHAREAMTIYERELGIEDESTIQAMINLGIALTQQGRLDSKNYDEAELLFKKSVEQLRRFHPENTELLAIVLRGRGANHARRHRTAEATADFDEAIRLLGETFGDNHREVIGSKLNLYLEISRTNLIEGINGIRALFAEMSQSPIFRERDFDLSLVRMNLGLLLTIEDPVLKLDQLNEGIRHLEIAIEEFQDIAPGHQSIAEMQFQLAYSHVRRGNLKTGDFLSNARAADELLTAAIKGFEGRSDTKLQAKAVLLQGRIREQLAGNLPTPVPNPAPPAGDSPTDGWGAPAGGAWSLIVDSGEWNYFDKGEDLGTDWRDNDFNDAAWARGISPLGADPDDDGTLKGIVKIRSEAGDAIPTIYFRRRFDWSERPADNGIIRLHLQRDDGIAVHLNGQTILSDNLEPNAGFEDHAQYVVGSVEQEASLRQKTAYFRSKDLPFVNGVNVLAVEVHQFNSTSSDLFFDLSMGYREIDPSPKSECPLYLPDDPIAGRSAAEWAGNLINWTESMPQESRPSIDPTGKLATIHQKNPVFFLAPGIAGEILHRKFAVPKGVPIAVPLFLTSYFRTPEPGTNRKLSADEVKRRNFLNGGVNHVDRLHFRFNGQDSRGFGVDLFDHRIGDHFNAKIEPLSAANMRREPVGEWENSYISGYIVILHPPEPGKTHTIEYGFGLSYATGITGARCTATITVPEN